MLLAERLRDADVASKGAGKSDTTEDYVLDRESARMEAGLEVTAAVTDAGQG